MRTLEEIIKRMNENTIIDPITDCWLFQGAQNKGQGVIGFNYRMTSVSRLSAAYYLEYDLSDKTKQINHRIICLNKNCWNPDHLYIGTESENKADRFYKDEWHTGNQYTNATHCKRGHEFTEENTYYGPRGRKCKQCVKDYNKLYKEGRG